MALLKSGAKTRVFVIGRDHGEPVRAKVQAVPAAVDRDLRRQALGDVKSRRSGSQPLYRSVERAEDLTRLRAEYALLDTKNFRLAVEDADAAQRYGTLLKRELKVGEEVLLDGCWSPDLKAAVFADFPSFAAKIDDLSQSISQADFEEEEEATEAF